MTFCTHQLHPIFYRKSSSMLKIWVFLLVEISYIHTINQNTHHSFQNLKFNYLRKNYLIQLSFWCWKDVAKIDAQTRLIQKLWIKNLEKLEKNGWKNIVLLRFVVVFFNLMYFSELKNSMYKFKAIKLLWIYFKEN